MVAERSGKPAPAPDKWSPSAVSHAESPAPLTLSDRRAFMSLTLRERRRALAEQARGVLRAYLDDSERSELQGGDVVEY